MGDLETEASASAESPLGYHSFIIGILTCDHELVRGQCQAGSLTGAVASKRVTEALKAWLSTDGKSCTERKRRSQVDCDTDGWSRYESRS